MADDAKVVLDGEDATLADVPVVVFTGGELSAEEDARIHTMARSIVVKGVESPERLLDETALFLHRVITNLPSDKQRMLDRLNSSDEDLIGRTVLLDGVFKGNALCAGGGPMLRFLVASPRTWRTSATTTAPRSRGSAPNVCRRRR